MSGLFQQSKVQMALALTAIAVSAFVSHFSSESLQVLLVSLISCIVFDFIFIKIRRIQPFFLSAAIVTGLIIGLLTGPNLPWYDGAIAGFMAMASKNFLRFGRHIFNPAGFGLLFSAIIFNHNISWWAASWQPFTTSSLPSLIGFLILLSPALVSAIRMRRYRIQFSWMLTNLLAILPLNLIAESSRVTVFQEPISLLLSQLRNVILDPTFLFFTLVMLPEPMTSPNRPARQILFGSVTAIVVILSSFLSFIPDPLTAALLTTNLIFFKYR